MQNTTQNAKEVAEQGANMASNFISNDVAWFIVKLVGAIAIVFIIIMIGKVLANIVRRNLIKHAEEGNTKHVTKVADLVQDVVFYISIIFAFFIGFEMMGLDIALILWWISFGVWLAFKEILGNMIAGMMILYTKELKLWDIVEIMADQTYFGRIEEITIRYTLIRTLDLRQVVIPNLKLISSPIKTFSAENIIKLTLDAYVDYYSDLEKTIKVIRETINSFDFIKEKESTKVFVTEFEDSEIWLKCIFFFDPNCGILADYAIGYVREAIYAAYAQNGIDMAYPHITLHFDDNEQKKEVKKALDKAL